MKKFFFLSTLLISFTRLLAQHPDSLNVLPQIHDSLLQKKLIQLVTTGPQAEIIDHQNKILQYQLKGAKNAWMNLFTVSFNYNELSSKSATSGFVYPKYFIGFTLPMGTLFSRTQVKASKEQIKVKENEREIMVRNVTAGILKMHLQYLNYSSLIILQRNLSDDEETAYLKAKSNFQKGTLTIENYTIAQKRYTEELIKAKQLELERDMLKLEIESLIGMTLEDAIREAAADKAKEEELQAEQLRIQQLNNLK